LFELAVEHVQERERALEVEQRSPSMSVKQS
jgi:hypothetical protein